ncbi:MAG: DUF1549 and DUF1553 domain-containing protein [Planctomycetaceae bacterium]
MNRNLTLPNRCCRRRRVVTAVAVVFVVLAFAVRTPAIADDSFVDSAGTREPAEAPITEADRNHWSFQPLKRTMPPVMEDATWIRNPIDAFVAAKLKELGLRPQPEAPPESLIRRLHLVLTGLPPTVQAIDDDLSNSSEAAGDDVVDKLLNSQAYGERWAQHWLDIARFAETDGFEHDKLRPDAWKFRDWVIQALNDDMPYDEFLRQQLAGDELYPDDESAAVATRFCLSGPDMPDINSQDERRHTLLNELTSTVGSALLALQMGCAECHDHKYDPISQADFYRLRAVFEPAVQVTKNQTIAGLHERLPVADVSHIMLRGDFRRPGPEVRPSVPRIASAESFTFRPVELQNSTGRRLALANWITDRENPLTARVIVNRVWQHHFGTGLSITPSDFGIMGEQPAHPELLDWLAAWLMDHDWSLKRLHRLIVTSATWRQRSHLPDDATPVQRLQWQESVTADPAARMLSRYPRWRLEGEAVRDAMLLAAGCLNRESGGPGIQPPLPDELLNTLLKNQWTVTDDPKQHDRRSIYVFARRNLRYPIFDVFDRPDANASCPRRSVSTTAPQSLHLLNSKFSLATAERFATSVSGETSVTSEQITEVFRRGLGRYPTADELAAATEFLSHPDTENGLAHLCLVIFNLNEFIYVD